MNEQIPQEITERYNTLMNICTEYPSHIPIKVLADFYGINVETMRGIITGGGCPYAQFIPAQEGGRKFFLIDTFTFFQFVTQGMFWKSMNPEKAT